MQTIGIMAGSGKFPFMIAENAKAKGFRVVVCGFENNTDPTLAKACDAFIMLGLGQLGSLIRFFKEQNVTKACMAGAINKPRALDFKPDARAAKLLFRLLGNRGDDALLRALADEMKSEGITVIKPEELVPSLTTTTPGIIAGPTPSQEMWIDIEFGWKKAKELGALDIGQSIAVRDQVIVAIEAIEGTDAMLKRAGSLASGCVAVKVMKPEQDERADKPSIGEKTIAVLADQNFCCLAFEAKYTLFFDRETSIAKANEKNLTLIAIPEDALSFFSSNINR